jgi:hypothetical protein
VTKLLLILALGGALAGGLSSHKEPPLLIQDTTAAPLDVSNQ